MLLQDCLNRDRFKFGDVSRTMINGGVHQIGRQPLDNEKELEREKKQKLAEALQVQIRNDKYRKQRDKSDYHVPKVGEGLSQTVEENTLSAEEAGFAPSHSRTRLEKMYSQYEPLNRGMHLTQQGVSGDNIPNMMIIVCSSPVDMLDDYIMQQEGSRIPDDILRKRPVYEQVVDQSIGYGQTKPKQPFTYSDLTYDPLPPSFADDMYQFEVEPYHKQMVEDEYGYMVADMEKNYQEMQLQRLGDEMDALEQELYFRSNVLASELARQRYQAEETKYELEEMKYDLGMNRW